MHDASGAALEPQDNARSRLPIRLAIGIAQGIALALLAEAIDDKTWPTTDERLFAPLFVLTLFLPPLMLVSASMRSAMFAFWSIVWIGLISALTYYDIWWHANGPGNIWASPEFMISLAGLLFIVQALVSAADANGSPVAPYTVYFETAWKLGLQALLSVAFVALLWGILWLGAQLFQLIGLDFLKRLLNNRWFGLPITAAAFAYAVDITDVRAGLIGGVRSITLMLLSWILPVMTLLAIAFLAALPFTGLEALWATRSATALLLTAAAWIIILVNAAYRDGAGDVPGLIRISGTIGAIALIPLVAIACYALMQRIGQYGLTPDRIIAFFCAGIAVCFAVGYAIAAVNFGGWLKALEAANVFISFLVVAVLLSLLSPLANPARLSVNDQVARLARGKMEAETFDYDFLRFKSGRYGMAALNVLAKHGVGKDPDKVAKLAAEALARSTAKTPAEPPLPSAPELTAQISVYPKGGTLPESFLKQGWRKSMPYFVPDCLTKTAKCFALIADVDGDGISEILLFGEAIYQRAAFKLGPAGEWQVVGTISPECSGANEALDAGAFTVRDHPYKDVIVGGRRLTITMPDCAPAEQGPPTNVNPPAHSAP